MTDTTSGPFATQDLRQVSAALDNITLSSSKVSQSLSRTFASAIIAGKSFDQTLQSVLASLSKMALTSALQPLMQGATTGLGQLVTGLLGGLTGGALATTPGMPLAQPFAEGGVVARPTFFGSNGGLGLMGERGAEAILPLARGPGGQLGVVAQGQGGASNVTVNITTPDVNGFRQSQVQVASALARAVARGQRGL